jgi:hypothetical protein
MFGINVRRFLTACFGLPSFLRTRQQFLKQARGRSEFTLGKLYPCLGEANDPGGSISQYFLQDLHVATLISKRNPDLHVDVGSRIDGFVANVASFRPIEVFDIRPLRPCHPNILFKQADLMDPSFLVKDYCDSLSCLHALEHFGLGRYGDSISYDGHLLGLRNLSKMLKAGGTLYLSVPIGPQRIEFNAHRVFNVRYILDLLSAQYNLRSFSYINESPHFFPEQPLEPRLIETNFDCSYGVGIFEAEKRPRG